MKKNLRTGALIVHNSKNQVPEIVNFIWPKTVLSVKTDETHSTLQKRMTND